MQAPVFCTSHFFPLHHSLHSQEDEEAVNLHEIREDHADEAYFNHLSSL